MTDVKAFAGRIHPDVHPNRFLIHQVAQPFQVGARFDKSPIKRVCRALFILLLHSLIVLVRFLDRRNDLIRSNAYLLHRITIAQRLVLSSRL